MTTVLVAVAGATCIERSAQTTPCGEERTDDACAKRCGGTYLCHEGNNGISVWKCSCELGDAVTSASTAHTTTQSSVGYGGCHGPTDCGPCPFMGVCKTGAYYDCSHCSYCDYEGSTCLACQQCQTAERCWHEFNECMRDPVCVDYAQCILACADDACASACAIAFPEGAVVYAPVAFCMLSACSESCDEKPSTGGGGAGGSGGLGGAGGLGGSGGTGGSGG